MHIPENYLSPSTCAVLTAVMLPVWYHAVQKVKNDLPKEKLPLLGVGAAFSFLAMMFNVPLPGGTTGHAVGGTLAAILFGPHAACLAVSIALLLQAVIFGDGGILSFGANCFNMAFVLPYLGFALYKAIIGSFSSRTSTAGHCLGAAVGGYVGLSAAAFFTAVEFGIQPMLFKDELGQALYCPYDLSIAIPAMMLPHLLMAAVVEALFTAAVLSYVLKTMPSLVVIASEEDNVRRSAGPMYLLAAALVVLTPLGLLAEGTAWGEWGVDEIAEIAEGGKALGYVPKGLAEGWSFEPFIPDYALDGYNETAVYILSAVIGVALLIIIFKLFALLLKGNSRVC